MRLIGLAAQRLYQVPTSKRGEILIIQRMSLVMDLSTASASGRKAFEKLFEGGPNASNVEALCVRSSRTKMSHDGSSGDARPLLKRHDCIHLDCLPIV